MRVGLNLTGATCSSHAHAAKDYVGVSGQTYPIPATTTIEIREVSGSAAAFFVGADNAVEALALAAMIRAAALEHGATE